MRFFMDFLGILLVFIVMNGTVTPLLDFEWGKWELNGNLNGSG
jgi:hypothetical protein